MAHIVVVSDLHANVRAVRAALTRAFSGPMDELIVLGDALTYGIDIDETLDLLEETQTKVATSFIVGNHDELYFDIVEGKHEYVARLPEWIRESIELTAKSLDVKRLRRFGWVDDLQRDEVFFAHANPFGPKDWTYLRTDEDIARAAAVIARRGARMGVFGHTHRAIITRLGEIIVANSGSVGQPRSHESQSTLLRVNTKQVNATIEPIDYDVHGHTTALRRAPLTDATRNMLVAFFG